MVTLVNWNYDFSIVGYKDVTFKVLAVYKCPNYGHANFIAISDNGVVVDYSVSSFKRVF